MRIRFFALLLVGSAISVSAQTLDTGTVALANAPAEMCRSNAPNATASPSGEPETGASAQRENQSADSTQLPDAPLATQAAPPAQGQQPKRILGVMPNFRAVSVGETPPPPTPKQAFVLATRNSFDYSAFVFVGITSLLAEGTDAHPALGKGVDGYGRYYWRGFLDKADGNYWVIFALPLVDHEDERYYTKGTGSILGRGIYAASRVVITPNYHGHNTINFSDILGRGIAQVIGTSYYPSSDRTAGTIAVKYGWAMGRDALTDVFREFWPDIATHVLHRHP